MCISTVAVTMQRLGLQVKLDVGRTILKTSEMDGVMDGARLETWTCFCGDYKERKENKQ